MFYICFNTNIVLCKSFYLKVVIIIQGKCAEIADRLDTLRINPTKNTANDYIEIGAVKLNDKLCLSYSFISSFTNHSFPYNVTNQSKCSIAIYSCKHV